jgi:uncharacterized membrane protein YGL010W
MRVTLRLVLNVLAWAVSIPVLNVCLTALERNRIMPLSGPVAAVVAVTLLLWAALIYWRCVPSTASIVTRLSYLVAFVVAMVLVSFGAVWVAFWASVAIFGL